MTRGTPGLILLLFAALLLVAALVQVIQARHESDPDEAEPVSGLGDTHYYTGLSENDYYNAALLFDAAPKGLFRRTVKPVPRSDSRMIRCCLESSGQFIVYSEWHPASSPKAAGIPRWYLKAGPDRYVEFGERKYFPAYQSPAIQGAFAPVPQKPYVSPTPKKNSPKGSKPR
jgi:hypothetical protein